MGLCDGEALGCEAVSGVKECRRQREPESERDRQIDRDRDRDRGTDGQTDIHAYRQTYFVPDVDKISILLMFEISRRFLGLRLQI